MTKVKSQIEKRKTLFFSFQMRERNPLKSEVCICRTLLNSPLLRRKRGDRGGGGGGGGDVGGSENKSSLDSSEEDLNICANSATNSPTPRHRLLQVQLYFCNFF